MKTNKTKPLSFFISIIALCISCIAIWKIQSLEFENEERKRDEFIVQTIDAIFEKDATFLKHYSGLDLGEIEWKEKISKGYWIHKDTGLSYVEYVIFFDDGFLLYIDTGKKLSEFYGGATFKINIIGEARGEYEGWKREHLTGPYNYIGPHRIYLY